MAFHMQMRTQTEHVYPKFGSFFFYYYSTYHGVRFDVPLSVDPSSFYIPNGMVTLVGTSPRSYTYWQFYTLSVYCSEQCVLR